MKRPVGAGSIGTDRLRNSSLEKMTSPWEENTRTPASCRSAAADADGLQHLQPDVRTTPIRNCAASVLSWSLAERWAPKYWTPMNAPPTTSMRAKTSAVN